ncbi:CRP/FNR family transcriptional regulator, anaerobic regulatory protein [Neorhodopirellula lusitana]|uniref:CRP/FNR family transcriptional regulator, anaerobic regulatory protein n=2 Tax=Neorhodopirellula lusitana TaxID=445327 RepID=A0ABY1PWR7_9BACT|nr:CRP/FNR family transcriptional regulator, anaerobic regulatory protein [Neorhodopirellula lusitana]
MSAVAGAIHGCPLLSRLNESNRSILASVALLREYQAGERIFNQGDPCPGMFIVERGLVRVYRGVANGQQHVLHLCGPTESFAEVAVFANSSTPASAEAIRPTRCVLIPLDAFQKALAENHELCLEMLAGMARWTRHFVDLLDDLVLRDSLTRVANFLLGLPVDPAGLLKLPGPKKDIANHLNVTSETFSRTLRRLNEDGAIETNSGRHIRIVNPDRLQQIGER